MREAGTGFAQAGRQSGGVERAEPRPSLEVRRGTELVGQPRRAPARAGGVAAPGDRPDHVDGLGFFVPALDVEEDQDGLVGRAVGDERAGLEMGTGGGRRQDDGEKQEQRGRSVEASQSRSNRRARRKGFRPGAPKREEWKEKRA